MTVLQSQQPPLHLTTQSHILRVLKMALTYGVRRGWLPRNPMAGERFTRTTPVKAARALTEVQVQQVLAAVAGTWVEGPTRLALYTGMRRGEVCALRWQDVDLRHRVIQVRASVDRLELKGPKGGRERAVPVDRKTAEWLRRLSQRSPSDWVFPAEDGTQLYPDSLTNAFSRITKRHFHDLRHTHASWLLRDGVSLVEVSVSTETQLNVRSTTLRKTRSRSRGNSLSGATPSASCEAIMGDSSPPESDSRLS